MEKLLDLYRDNNATLNDAFDRIVVGIHLKKQELGYKTFLLCGCEPSVGTTTVSINLAISTALAGWKTILVEGDMRKGKQYKRLNDKAEKGLADYLTQKASLSQVIYGTNYELLHYLPSGDNVENPVNLLCSGQMDELYKALLNEYDYIFFDMPSVNTVVDACALAKKTDAVILVTAQEEGTKSLVNSAKVTFEQAGANILGVVLNKVDRTEYKRYLKNYDYFKSKRYAKRH